MPLVTKDGLTPLDIIAAKMNNNKKMLQLLKYKADTKAVLKDELLSGKTDDAKTPHIMNDEALEICNTNESLELSGKYH